MADLSDTNVHTYACINKRAAFIRKHRDAAVALFKNHFPVLLPPFYMRTYGSWDVSVVT